MEKCGEKIAKGENQRKRLKMKKQGDNVREMWKNRSVKQWFENGKKGVEKEMRTEGYERRNRM